MGEALPPFHEHGSFKCAILCCFSWCSEHACAPKNSFSTHNTAMYDMQHLILFCACIDSQNSYITTEIVKNGMLV